MRIKISRSTLTPQQKNLGNHKCMRQHRTVGGIVEISLEPEKKVYARILGEASFAFYDYVNIDESVDLADIITKPILFILAVYDDAVTKGRWKKIGKIPLEPALQVLPLKFIQDGLDESRFEIYDNGNIRPASRDECIGLERAAVWEPEHVESRILDYYRGLPNKWEMQMRLN